MEANVKVTLNQSKTNITKENPIDLKNNIKNDIKIKLASLELHGRAIDPLTKVEFVKTRRNQIFQFPENRIAYHNLIHRSKTDRKKNKNKIKTLFDLYLNHTFKKSNIENIGLVSDKDICDYLKKIKI